MIYGNKHVVFESVGLEGTNGSGTGAIDWNSASNVDSDNACNDWNISNMRSRLQSNVLLRFSSDLQDIMTNTTIQTATNGNNGTLVNTSDKLFLAAEKEVYLYASLSKSEERTALTTWQYYTTHTGADYRIKYKNGDLTSAASWWTRSPRSDDLGLVIYVTSGYFSNMAAYDYARIAPVFAL